MSNPCPAGKTGGVFSCVLRHVNWRETDVVIPPGGAFRRLVSGVGGYENSFQSGLRNSAGIRARQHRCFFLPLTSGGSPFLSRVIDMVSSIAS